MDQAIAAEAETKQREIRIQEYIAKAQLPQKEVDTITASKSNSNTDYYYS